MNPVDLSSSLSLLSCTPTPFQAPPRHAIVKAVNGTCRTFSKAEKTTVSEASQNTHNRSTHAPIIHPPSAIADAYIDAKGEDESGNEAENDNGSSDIRCVVY